MSDDCYSVLIILILHRFDLALHASFDFFDFFFNIACF
jgi:hypothetical protein